MTDDERERLIAALREGEYAWACEAAAAQLRADRKKIEALEAVAATASRRF